MLLTAPYFEPPDLAGRVDRSQSLFEKPRVDHWNDLLASVTLLEVPQASHARKAPDFCRRKPQQNCCALLPDLFLVIHTHSWTRFLPGTDGSMPFSKLRGK